MTLRIDLSAGHRQIVLKLLAELLPGSTQVWVFGSRATGRARRYSDLDLAIDAGRPLSLDEAALLREAFEESDLPYRVDLVDWHAIGDRFLRLIAAERLPLDMPAESPAGLATASSPPVGRTWIRFCPMIAANNAPPSRRSGPRLSRILRL